jgi:hypothetical protein
MPVVRRLGAIATVVMTLMLTACTTSTVKPTGVVTGFADACVGLVLAGSTLPRVTVLLYSGPTVVASTTAKSGAMYRLSVAPGSYKVETQQVGFHYRPKVVVVRAGHSVTADFPDYCK